jgi:hypothetical protein
MRTGKESSSCGRKPFEDVQGAGGLERNRLSKERQQFYVFYEV